MSHYDTEKKMLSPLAMAPVAVRTPRATGLTQTAKVHVVRYNRPQRWHPHCKAEVFSQSGLTSIRCRPHCTPPCTKGLLALQGGLCVCKQGCKAATARPPNHR